MGPVPSAALCNFQINKFRDNIVSTTIAISNYKTIGADSPYCFGSTFSNLVINIAWYKALFCELVIHVFYISWLVEKIKT